MDTWPHGRQARPAGQAGLNLYLCMCVIQYQSLLLMLPFQLPTLSMPRCPRAFLAYLLTVTLVATSVCVQAEHFTKAVSDNSQQTAPNFHSGKMAEMAELSPPASPTPIQSTISEHDAVKIPGRKKKTVLCGSILTLMPMATRVFVL